MDTKEKKHESVSNTAIMEVSSSSRCVSVKLATCKDVMTNKQKPRRLADVLRMCCEVLLAMRVF